MAQRARSCVRGGGGAASGSRFTTEKQVSKRSSSSPDRQEFAATNKKTPAQKKTWSEGHCASPNQTAYGMAALIKYKGQLSRSTSPANPAESKEEAKRSIRVRAPSQEEGDAAEVLAALSSGNRSPPGAGDASSDDSVNAPAPCGHADDRAAGLLGGDTVMESEEEGMRRKRKEEKKKKKKKKKKRKRWKEEGNGGKKEEKEKETQTGNLESLHQHQHQHAHAVASLHPIARRSPRVAARDFGVAVPNLSLSSSSFSSSSSSKEKEKEKEGKEGGKEERGKKRKRVARKVLEVVKRNEGEAEGEGEEGEGDREGAKYEQWRRPPPASRSRDTSGVTNINSDKHEGRVVVSLALGRDSEQSLAPSSSSSSFSFSSSPLFLL